MIFNYYYFLVIGKYNFFSFKFFLSFSKNKNQFIENIIEDVWQKLKHIYPQSEPIDLIGIDKILARTDLLLSKIQSIKL